MTRNINSDVYGYGSEISRTCVDTPFFKIEGICGNMNEKLEIKPENAEITTSRLASVVFYCLRRKTLKKVDQYLSENLALQSRSFGHFVNWLMVSPARPRSTRTRSKLRRRQRSGGERQRFITILKF